MFFKKFGMANRLLIASLVPSLSVCTFISLSQDVVKAFNPAFSTLQET